jgi:hypothetical protein
MRCAILVLLGLASTASAQQITLSGPVEAYTFDLPTGSLRAVIGFPGSASFGPALLDGIDFASVAPHKNYAIAHQGDTWLLVSGLGSDQIFTSSLAGLNGQPDGIVWSGDGSVAVFFSRAGNWVRSVTGFPDNPSAAASVDLASLGGQLAAVAADKSGKQIAVAMHGDAPGVYLMTDGQPFVSVLQLANPVALTFSEDGATLFAIDAGALQLSVFHPAGFDSQTLALEGFTEPFAVRAARDAQSREVVYVAGRGDRLVREYEVSSQQSLADVWLDFEPTGLDDFGRGSFVVASRAKDTDPLWLFSRVPQPGVFFVPAAQSASGGSQ